MKPQKLSEAELASLSGLGSPSVDILAQWVNKRLTCAHCKGCTRKCEVLEQAGLDIGLVEEAYQQVAGRSDEDRPAAVRALAQGQPEMFRALRRCCFCGFCTSLCEAHMLAPERMREWRDLFIEAGLLDPKDSSLVMVDNEWHIFNAYRAIYGIAYPEFLQLKDVAEQGPGKVDTLLFPGCSLVSYAPLVVRELGRWMDGTGVAWAMSDECCGSPLMSAGLFDRAEALREKLFDQIRAAGITRMLTVCPGCGEEFAELAGDEIDIVPLPEFLLEMAKKGNARFCAQGTEATPAAEGAADASLTFFDSCHDRFDRRHGRAIRRLLSLQSPGSARLEMAHHGKHTLCCGAGGAASAFDEDISHKRVWRIIDEAQATGAHTLVTACPTCTYTIAQALLGKEGEQPIENRHYLELLFGQTIDWPTVFSQLESMWSGEYGPWLAQTFF